MKKLLTLVSLVLLLPLSSLALSPPQYEYQKKLRNSIGSDPCIEVGEVVEKDGQSEITVVGCNQEIALAMLALLRQEIRFGNLLLLIKIVGPDNWSPGKSSIKKLLPYELKRLIYLFFEKNPYIKQIYHPGLMATYTVGVLPAVIQFWNDNMGDVHGFCHYLASDVFAEIINPTLIAGDNPITINFNTEILKL